MKNGCLPGSNDSADLKIHQNSMRADYHVKFSDDLNPDGGKGFTLLLPSDLKDFIQRQQKLFQSTASTANKEHESDDDLSLIHISEPTRPY